MLYNDDERKQKQREHALKCYYRKKALKQALEQGLQKEGDATITITVKMNCSKKIGPLDEVITYNVHENGKLIKQQDKN